MSFKDKIKYKENPFDKDKDNVVLARTVDPGRIKREFANELIKQCNLTKRNFRILSYLVKKCNQDGEAIIDMDDCKEKCNVVSNSTYYHALEKLIDCNMIARSNQGNIYFINPVLYKPTDKCKLIISIQAAG